MSFNSYCIRANEWDELGCDNLGVVGVWKVLQCVYEDIIIQPTLWSFLYRFGRSVDFFDDELSSCSSLCFVETAVSMLMFVCLYL
jgi:hypothetical protein